MHQKRTLILAMLSFFISALLIGCTNSGEHQYESKKQNEANYEVIIRFDKQNDVYNQLAELLEDYIVSDKCEVEVARFNGYCEGINCFIRDEILISYYNQIFQDNQSALETVKGLMSVSTRNELDRLQLSEFSNHELEQLKMICVELAECCNRGKRGSFAYYISIQEVEGNSYEKAANKANDALKKFDEILNAKGVIIK